MMAGAGDQRPPIIETAGLCLVAAEPETTATVAAISPANLLGVAVAGGYKQADARDVPPMGADRLRQDPSRLGCQRGGDEGRAPHG